MQFVSVPFFIFLAVSFALFWAVPNRVRPLVLLVSSLFFYLYLSPKMVIFPVLASLLIWLTGMEMEKSGDGKKKKILLISGIAVLVLCLAAFKYINEIRIGDALLIRVIMPLGVSFYTFRAISYLADIGRGDIRAEENPIYCFLLIMFFPMATSGPIERGSGFLPQLKQEFVFDPALASRSGLLIVLGIIKKVCVADLLAVPVDTVFNNIHDYSGPVIVLGAVLYSFQLFFDFSGYSDMAVGIAGLFGIKLTRNFNAPYLSKNFADFWKRWHISLTSWLQDYIFIPLTWSRWWDRLFYRKTMDERKPSVLINIFMVFLVSGIWHGTGFTFLVWGILHGVYRVIEELVKRERKKRKKRAPKGGVANIIGVFLLNAFTNIFFRANNIGEAGYAAVHLLSGWNLSSLLTAANIALMMKTLVVAYAFIIMNIFADLVIYNGGSVEEKIMGMPKMRRWALYFALVLVAFFMFLHGNGGYGNAQQFIYFQF